MPRPDSWESSDFDDISVASFESGDESFDEQNDYGTSQIRVARLNPATDKRADIHCTLERASSDKDAENQPSYEALSYTWGNIKRDRVIYVDGHPFPVTLNLDVALRYLRKPSEPRVLWVDAICIDQENLQEKNHQVGMMRKIYVHASQVVVWLGESDKDTRKAMALLKCLEGVDTRFPKKDKIGPFISGLDKIFKHPWWFRVWTFQEVIVAKKPPLVVCGRKSVSWYTLRRAMSSPAWAQFDGQGFFRNPLASVFFGLMPTEFSDHSKEERAAWRTLEKLVQATCGHEATIPHDKIFALLGVAEDGTSQEIIPDYRQPYTAICQNAMVHILSLASSLNFLIQAMNRRKEDVPSWCVDFSQPDWNSYSWRLSWPAVLDDASGASGGLSQSKINYNPDKSTLEISGSIIGYITHVEVSENNSANFPSVWSSSHYLKTVESFPLIERLALLRKAVDSVVADLISFAPVAEAAHNSFWGS